MILKVHLDGAASYDVGDEIWQESLADAIHAEAETIAGYAGSDLLQSSDQAQRNALRDRIVGEMTAALVSVGDRYRAPDGVLYSLIEESSVDAPCGGGRLSGYGQSHVRADRRRGPSIRRPTARIGWNPPCCCSLERRHRRCGDDLVQRRDPRVRRRPRREDASRDPLTSFPPRSRLAAVVEPVELSSCRSHEANTVRSYRSARTLATASLEDLDGDRGLSCSRLCSKPGLRAVCVGIEPVGGERCQLAIYYQGLGKAHGSGTSS